MTSALELAAGGAAAAAVRRGRALVGLLPTLSRAGRSRGTFDPSDRGTWRSSISSVSGAIPDRVGSLRSISRLTLAKRRINLRLRFRSEERRVGKEGSYRKWVYALRKRSKQRGKRDGG